MWTDPPYGVDYRGGTKDALTIENDDEEGLPALLAGAFAASAPELPFPDGDGVPHVHVRHRGDMRHTFGIREPPSLWARYSPQDSVRPSMWIERPELAIHFIDVGQGDCTLVECPNGETVLIDCGTSGGVSGYFAR